MNTEFAMVEIEMPDGQMVWHDGVQWKYPDEATKVVVEYFMKTLPEDDYYPDLVTAHAENLVKRIVRAKIVRVDRSRMPPYDPDALY